MFRQKTQRVRNIGEIFEKFLRKLQKMYYFNIFGQDSLKNNALNFRGFRQKTKGSGNFEKIWKLYEKSLNKITKMYYFSIFFKIL